MTLEQQILAKLKSLGDTELNRVARAFARVRFGTRFKWIDGLGYNEEGKPIGWRPDVFALMAEEHLDRIEATATSSKRGIWRNNGRDGHFPKVLRKIADSKVGGGLVYIAGHPDVQFTPDLLRKMTDAAVNAGLTRDLVQIIGSDALADALSQPEMAGVRIGWLEVGDPKRFSLVRREVSPDRARLIRAGMANPFIPTKEDLDAGAIYFPELGHQVEQRLREERIALVRGLGASGKSVLAWLVGLRWRHIGDPAYHLSLRNFLSGDDLATRECVEELTLFSADNALFIVDDCHLNEEAARRLYLAWQGLKGSQPTLFLVSREMRSRKGSRIHEIDVEPLLLLARQNEVRGVFTRLVARHLRETRDPVPLPTTPDEVLELWVRTFGGDLNNPNTTTDLIAFSAAVQHRMNQLLRCDWTLSEEHAADEMREQYLGPLLQSERRNLILLSAVQRFEIEMPGALLPDVPQGLRSCIDNLGIVLSRAGGFARADTLYQLAHSALARLIITASGERIDEAEVFESLATRNGHFALAAHRRLVAAGEVQIANVVRRAMFANPHLFKQLSFGNLKSYLRLAEQSRDQEDVKSFLASLTSPETTSAIISNGVTSPLDHLADFLHHLEESGTDEFRKLHMNLANGLSDEGLVPKFVDTASRGPLNDLAYFLRYLAKSKADGYRRLHENLANALSDEGPLRKFVEASFRSPLNDVADFLGYIEESKTDGFRKLHVNLANALSDEGLLPKFVEAAFRGPLNFLANFLRYLEKSKAVGFRRLHQNLAIRLADEDLLLKFIEAATRSPLNDLTDFLRYLEKSKTDGFRGLHQNLSTGLADEDLLPKFVEAATRSPLDFLADFLRYLETSTSSGNRAFRDAIVRQLCAPEVAAVWAQKALRSPTDQLEGFLNYVGLREEFDPLVSSLSEKCPAGADHADNLAQRAMSILTEAVVAGEFGAYRTALNHVRRMLSVFGAGTAPAIREVVKDARLYEVSFSAALGE